MTNPWIEHVKKYAKDNNISYGCAITEAKKTYVKKSATKPATDKPEAKKDTTGDEIKYLEDDLKEIEKNYDERVFSGLSVEAISGRRMPPLFSKDIMHYAASHKETLNKLAKLTKKSYAPLTNISKIRKDLKKEIEKEHKIDKENERLKKLQPVIPDDPAVFKFKIGRKKTKGAIL